MKPTSAIVLDRHQVAACLDEVATLLELSGENPFKVRAYSNASRLLEGLEGDFAALVTSEGLGDLKGIGAALEEKITTLATTGSLPYLEELRSKFPPTLPELFRVPGLGPKKVKVLYDRLGIHSLGELEYACQENRLLALEGFGAKSQEKILAGIEMIKGHLGRFLYSDAIDRALELEGEMKRWKDVIRVSIAGSLRRCNETVKDVDLLCSSTRASVVMEKFVNMKSVASIVAKGETKSSVRLYNRLQVDLRVVTDDEYPFALHHFTGSREHNTAMRVRAKAQGLKMNEYGIFRGKKRLSCRNEEEVFGSLGLAYIPPELREDRGEIALAEKGPFPKLVEVKDLRGLFHFHTTYSDGRNTLEEMLEGASILGLEYVGVSDHSQSASYAGGLKEKDIERQYAELDKLEKRFPKLRIFRGIESDILSDGSLDYPDKVLAKFDFVIGSVHSHFQMTEDAMTERCLRALENRYLTILGHPTGRLLLSRDGFKIDLHRIIRRAAELGKIVELNANPHRLDLDWRVVGYAKELGVKLAVDPDAHDVAGFRHIRFGVNIARKGGLTKNDLFTTLPLKKMESALAAIRA